MRTTPIEKVCEKSPMQALVIDEDVPVVDVIDQFAAAHGRYSIFIVDEQQRLTAVVSNNDLLSWAKIYFDLIPPEQPLPVGRVRRLLQARTVSDLAPPESHRMSVRLDETVATAIETMASFGLEDIAVVDGDGRVVNDLRLSEVLSFALHLNNKQANA
jgi:CBS-domain-containing membrane protein